MRKFLLPAKISWRFKKEEWYLFLLVFFWFSFSSFFLNEILKTRLPLEFLLYIIFENYLTVCIYYGLKQSIWDGKIERNIFLYSLHFFFRIFGYRVFFAFLFGLLLMIPIGLSANIQSLKIINLIFLLSILWISLPTYYLLLTLYSPLIILINDVSFFESIKKSYNFMKKNLGEIFSLSIFLSIMWGFVIFLDKIYNFPVRFLEIFLRAILTSYLEIFTVKVFLNFYKLKGEGEK